MREARRLRHTHIVSGLEDEAKWIDIFCCRPCARMMPPLQREGVVARP
jgi:hypothetical protein